jgi:hypothetical protein
MESANISARPASRATSGRWFRRQPLISSDGASLVGSETTHIAGMSGGKPG